MKVKYIGESFGVDSLTDGKVYEVTAVENGEFRVIDDSDEDYLYEAGNPSPRDGSGPGGRWEIVEDDEDKSLAKAIAGY